MANMKAYFTMDAENIYSINNGVVTRQPKVKNFIEKYWESKDNVGWLSSSNKKSVLIMFGDRVERITNQLFNYIREDVKVQPVSNLTGVITADIVTSWIDDIDREAYNYKKEEYRKYESEADTVSDVSAMNPDYIREHDSSDEGIPESAQEIAQQVFGRRIKNAHVGVFDDVVHAISSEDGNYVEYNTKYKQGEYWGRQNAARGLQEEDFIILEDRGPTVRTGIYSMKVYDAMKKIVSLCAGNPSVSYGVSAGVSDNPFARAASVMSGDD